MTPRRFVVPFVAALALVLPALSAQAAPKSTAAVAGASAAASPLAGLKAPTSKGAAPKKQRDASPEPIGSDAAAGKAPLRPALKKVLAIVNEERTSRGIPPLKYGRCLTKKVAQPWARHMADVHQMYHRDLNEVYRLCPGFSTVGENVAMGQRTAREVMTAWMNSSGHRANILRESFTKIGLGVARDENGSRYWVQNFGG